jgi:hypothetical protein
MTTTGVDGRQVSVVCGGRTLSSALIRWNSSSSSSSQIEFSQRSCKGGYEGEQVDCGRVSRSLTQGASREMAL